MSPSSSTTRIGPGTITGHPPGVRFPEINLNGCDDRHSDRSEVLTRTPARRPLDPRFRGDDALESASFTRADVALRVDLDDQLRRRERAYLDQGRGREVAGEELGARLPDFLAVLDVGDEDAHARDVI